MRARASLWHVFCLSTPQRAQEIQKLVPAFQTLYGALSDQQKREADQMFRSYAANTRSGPQAAAAR